MKFSKFITQKLQFQGSGVSPYAFNFGLLYASGKQIAISSRLLAMGVMGVREVVLHEVAHAIVHARLGNNRGHTDENLKLSEGIGYEPKRYVDVSTEKWQMRIRYAAR
ncbi:MAG: hypothetical protein CM1200mP39_20890 [Dehalococcoidia bacterium]|nr:MAG: hypothetical protein CM1200mP39_20890 [Dehalococcoidia bacterium]